MHTSEFPNITHSRVTAISIHPLFTVNREIQTRVVDTIGQMWKQVKPPAGLSSGYVFNSENGESTLIYLQWKSAEHIRNMGQTDFASIDRLLVEPYGNPNGNLYRLYKSLENNHSGAKPEKLICAFFDTDGAERQKYICDRLIELGKKLPDNPSALSSHFHISLDGTRVINYTEWRDTVSHDENADAGVYDKIYEVSTSTPGVRSLRGNVYRLGLFRTF